MGDSFSKNPGRKLVEMSYKRAGQEGIKMVTVTEKQAYDIKVLLLHIQVVDIKAASENSERDYILV